MGGLRKQKKVEFQNQVPSPTQKPPITRERVVVQRRACARWIPEKKLEEWIHTLERPQGHPWGPSEEKRPKSHDVKILTKPETLVGV